MEDKYKTRIKTITDKDWIMIGAIILSGLIIYTSLKVIIGWWIG